MSNLVKFNYTQYGGNIETVYLSPTGVEKIEQSNDKHVRICYQQHCAFVDGNVNEVANLLGYIIK